MSDGTTIDLAGIVREREADDAALKRLAAEVIRELVATAPDALTPRLAELRARILAAT